MEDDSYACPICGGWFLKGTHQHTIPMNYVGCEHDYIPYPLPYMSSGNCGMKMMCRKCLKVEYLNG